MFGQMDAGRLKFAIECLLADFGKANVFFVVPSTDSNYETFAQPEYGKVPGMVFSKFQDAVDAASSGNGDKIFLLPGIHYAALDTLQHISYKDNVVFSGLPGYRDDTILKGGITLTTDICTLRHSGADCTFKDLTFLGYGAGKECVAVMGEVTYDGTDYGPPTGTKFENCRFEAQSATVGNGLELYDHKHEISEIQVSGCLFERCGNAIVYGSGISSTPPAEGTEDVNNIIVQDCVFRACQVDHAEPALNHSDVTLLLHKGNVHVDAKAGGSDHYLDLGTGTNTGLVTGCSFAHATAATAKMVIPAGIKWVNNHTEEVVDSTGTTDNRPD
tara:strand:- start:118 stop:1107 length:990 start_codon:yes stop_codon:yes gene_type:complete